MSSPAVDCALLSRNTPELLRLPTLTSQPALEVIDELLVATVAGLAGEAYGANLIGTVQYRSLLAMLFGGREPSWSCAVWSRARFLTPLE